MRVLMSAWKHLTNRLPNGKNVYNISRLTGIQSTRQIQSEAHSYHALELIWARTKVIGTSENYSNTIATPLPEKENLEFSNIQDVLDKQWISMSIQEMLENFEFLSYYAKKNTESIADPKYQGILEVMTSKIPECKDKDLQFLLKYLELWQLDSKNPTFKLFFEAIDKECNKRKYDWSVDEILLVNDLFVNIRLNRISNFTWYSLNKLGRKPVIMSPTNLVQFAFLLKTSRMITSPLYNVEYYFEQNVDHFTIDELAIFAMAFEKYKVSIKSKDFLIKIMQKLIDEIDTVSDITLQALLKIFRFIRTPDYIEQIEKLIVALETQIDKRSINNVVHIALWLKTIRYEKKELLSKMLSRFEIELPNIKNNWIDKILYTLFTFNYTPQETSFFALAFDEMLKPEREIEIEKYPLAFIKSNLSALNSGFYPKEALKQIMDPKFRNRYTVKKQYHLQEYLIMDYLIEIQHPDYDGPRIEKQDIILLLKRLGGLSNYIRRKHKKIVTKWFVLQNVMSICQKICGFESAVYEDMLLPHTALTDIVLCYDPETKKYLSPKEQISQIPNGEIKYAPKDGKDWYSLVVASDFVFTTNTRNPTGLLSVRLRNLEHIGFKPIVVPMFIWSRIREESERLEYLRKLLPE